VLAAATPEHIAATEAALVDTSRHLTSKGAHLLFVELPPVLPKDCGRHPDASTSRCEVPIVADPVQDPYNAHFPQAGRPRSTRVDDVDHADDLPERSLSGHCGRRSAAI
jgi:hypothetical protein